MALHIRDVKIERDDQVEKQSSISEDIHAANMKIELPGQDEDNDKEGSHVTHIKVEREDAIEEKMNWEGFEDFHVKEEEMDIPNSRRDSEEFVKSEVFHPPFKETVSHFRGTVLSMRSVGSNLTDTEAKNQFKSSDSILRVTSLNKHQETHLPICDCSHCRKKFRFKRYLGIYNGCYTCKICGKAFFSKSRLKRHVKSHANDKLFECDICGNKMLDRTYAINHIRCHIVGKKFLCGICGKCFSCEEFLGKKHTGKKPSESVICEECTNFLVPSDFHVDEKGYTCKICKVIFLTPDSLKLHAKTHGKTLSRRKKHKKHKCEVCGKKFKVPSLLRNHARVHEEYKCSICGIILASGHTLKEQRYYKCSVCEKGVKNPPLHLYPD